MRWHGLIQLPGFATEQIIFPDFPETVAAPDLIPVAVMSPHTLDSAGDGYRGLGYSTRAFPRCPMPFTVLVHWRTRAKLDVVVNCQYG